MSQNLFPVREINVETAHTKLCRKALSWLNNTLKCQIAVSELSYAREIPDALGWRWDTTILVECKVTRSDFLRDRKKEFRNQIGKGLGDYRFYLSPPGVIMPDDLPAKWGLLHLHGNSIKRVVYPDGAMGYREWPAFKHEANKVLEACMLVTIARRLKDNCPFIGARIGRSRSTVQAAE